MPMSAPVTLCLIAKDEEPTLPACIGSAADLVHEIIVIDTGSTDRTKEVAASFGARVFDFPWCDDFSAARNESLRHATGDWIFWLDADDRLDANGNRTSYTTGTDNRLTGDGTYSYTYDNEGNLVGKINKTTREQTTYSWDYQNRLTEVLDKSGMGHTLQDDKFTYDVDGRRIGKSTYSGSQTWTVYNGANPYADFNGSGSLTERYLYGQAVDELFARVDSSGNVAWYLTDLLGSVRVITDKSATVLDQITYGSWGNIVSETSPSNGDRFKFTGREWDSEPGLYYYRARYYDPAIGRFINEDPSAFGAGDANFYRYVDNSPADATDPSGLDSWPSGGYGAGGGGLGGSGGYPPGGYSLGGVGGGYGVGGPGGYGGRGGDISLFGPGTNYFAEQQAWQAQRALEYKIRWEIAGRAREARRQAALEARRIYENLYPPKPPEPPGVRAMTPEEAADFDRRARNQEIRKLQRNATLYDGLPVGRKAEQELEQENEKHLRVPEGETATEQQKREHNLDQQRPYFQGRPIYLPPPRLIRGR